MKKATTSFFLIFNFLFLPAQTVTVSINADSIHQAIEGFGATTLPLVYGSQDNLGANRADALAKAYNEVKLTMGNISAGNIEMDSSFVFGSSTNDDNDPFNYDWSGFNFKYSKNDINYLINPSAPYGFNNFMIESKINHRWGTTWMPALRSSNYNQYLDECAEYVLAVHKYWRDSLGIVQPYAMIFNEPLTGNGELNGGSVQEVVDIIKRVGDRFRAEGFDSIMIIAPNEETLTQTLTDVTAVLADSVARKYIGAIGHYARWLQKGAKRVESASSDSLIQISSFKDEVTNKFTLVAINNNSMSKTVKFDFSGIIPLGPVNGEQSYDTTRWEEISPVTPVSNHFTYPLLPNSITSFGGAFSIQTGINKIDWGNSVSISPNPANTKIKINISTLSKLATDRSETEIFNTIGERVLKTENQLSIDISGLISGMYYVKVALENNFFIAKFIKR
jgi:hypothetical protein